MSSHRNPVARDDWTTPPSIIALVRTVFGGAILLDPATVKENPTHARSIFTPETDGLKHRWQANSIFVNPPYRKPWYDKIASELSLMKWEQQCIALLMSKPGTAWFRNIARECDCVCFLNHRLRFGGSAAGAPFESALLYRGERAKRFELVFRDIGWIVDTRTA